MPTLPTQFSFKDGDAFPSTTPGRLRLYSMRFCPFAQRSRIVLAHKNIDFETVNVHLKSKPDWFIQRNPVGLVPVAEIDDKVIYESTAVSEWLDDVYPGEKLIPTDPDRRAQDRMLLESFGRVTSQLYKMMKEENREQALKDVQGPLQYYEDALAKRGGPYFGGDSLAMIDAYLYPHLHMFTTVLRIIANIDVLPEEKFPLLRKWHITVRDTPSVKSTTQTDEAYVNFFKSFASGTPDYDYKL